MEIFNKILTLTFLEKFADFHGFLAMLALTLFGASIILYFVSKRSSMYIAWLRKALLALFVNLVLLDIAGLIIYIPYRASGGPRTILKASELTSWLHTVVFEHKEFLAFAPPLIVFVAYLVTRFLGKHFAHEEVSLLRKSVIFSLTFGLIFVLLVAAEAVLVTKSAPVR